MKLSISDEVLAMLVCPETKQPLRLASEDEVSQWTAETTFEGALVAGDGSRAYPIRDGFPVIVISEQLTRQG